MKRICIAIVLIATSCSIQKTRLQSFNESLGENKATELTTLVKYFESYLADLYPGLTGFDIRFKKLLTDLRSSEYRLNARMILNDSIVGLVTNIYQLGGLHEELWIREDSIEYSVNPEKTLNAEEDISDLDDLADSVILYRSNINSGYHKGLSKFKKDKFIKTYIDARESMGDFSSPLMADAFIAWSDRVDYNDPILKRIVTMEIFIPIAYISLEKV